MQKNQKADSTYFRGKKRIREKDGFTMLEMVLATALVSIFFAMVAMLLPVWYKAYTQAIELNHARQVTDSVIGAIEEQIKFANQMEIVTEEDGIERLTGKGESSRFHIPMEESSNLIDGLVYDEKFFMNHDIELSFSMDETKKFCRVKVTVTRGSGAEKQPVLTRERAVTLSGENR